MEILATILCGGQGKRLWPLSRSNYPKQFIKNLAGKLSLFQMTALRIRKIAPTIKIACIGNEKHSFVIQQQLAEINIKAEIILESASANTLVSAIIAAYFGTNNNFEKVLIMPGDQICEERSFVLDMKNAILAHTNQLTVFGSEIIDLDCNLGYIKAGKQAGEFYKVEKFVEKPAFTTLQDLARDGNLYCNNGMILCRPEHLIKECSKFYPKECLLIETNLSSATFSPVVVNTLFLNSINNQSIDTGFLNYVSNLSMYKTQYKWQDMGNWQQIMEYSSQNCKAVKFDSSDCYVKNDNPAVDIILNGVKDLCVYASTDIICISNKKDISKISDRISSASTLGIKQNIEYRRWGYYKILFNYSGFMIKELHIIAGQKTSLQTHKLRAEYWVVSSGEAEITIGKEKYKLKKTEAAHIDPNEVHDIKNPHHQKELVIIEVQYGALLSESDIKRIAY